MALGNLTPEQVARLIATAQSNPVDGYSVSRNVVEGLNGPSYGDYNIYKTSPDNQAMLDMWDSQGNYAGQHERSKSDFIDTLIAAAPLAAGAAFGAGALGMWGPGAAGSGVGSGAGFVGEGALSGIPAWDGAMGGSMLSGGAGAAGAATAAGGGMGSASTSALGAAGSALGGSGALTGLLGAALGSKPMTSTNTSQNKLDPRMDSLLYGQNGQGGLLNYANSTLQSQMANGGLNDIQRQGLQMQLQAANDISGLGRGLLSAGVAGNPFMRK